MDRFSWSDSFQAVFGSCISCLGRPPRLDSNSEQNSNDRGGPIRARSDELEGLLAESDDAETLSLHSNLGDRDRSRKKRRQRKGIRLFGYDLFGRPPIHLPDDDEGVDDSGRRRDRLERSRTISTSTLDSDAAPLDSSTIEELSAAQIAERVTREDEERRAKEERRQRRRERKELKRAVLVLSMSGEGEFEGFPGSGPEHGHIASPFQSSTAGSSDLSSPHRQEDFGPFEQSQIHDDYDADDAETGDLDADAYTRRAPRGASMGSGSDSRSRTSASNSNPDSSRYNHYYLSQQPMQVPHMLANQPPHPFELTSSTPKKKKKSKRDKTSRQSVSTTSQSTSLASPTQQPSRIPFVPSPSVASADGEYINHTEFIAPEAKPAGGFPSVGLPGGIRRKNSEAGVFLARRGDE